MMLISDHLDRAGRLTRSAADPLTSTVNMDAQSASGPAQVKGAEREDQAVEPATGAVLYVSSGSVRVVKVEGRPTV